MFWPSEHKALIARSRAPEQPLAKITSRDVNGASGWLNFSATAALACSVPIVGNVVNLSGVFDMINGSGLYHVQVDIHSP